MGRRGEETCSGAEKPVRRWREVKGTGETGRRAVIKFTTPVLQFVGEALSCGKNVAPTSLPPHKPPCFFSLPPAFSTYTHSLSLTHAVMVHCAAGAHRAGTTGVSASHPSLNIKLLKPHSLTLRNQTQKADFLVQVVLKRWLHVLLLMHFLGLDSRHATALAQKLRP
eukprot:888645-Rhodomonas_salina.2